MSRIDVTAIERLSTEVRRSLADPAVVAKLAKLGIEPMVMSPAELSAYIAGEIQKWGGVVKAAISRLNGPNNPDCRAPGERSGEPGPILSSRFLWHWVPGLAEPVIGPRFARTRWLARDTSR